MKLKIANIDGCYVVINNLCPMILFFSKNIEIELNRRTSKFIIEYRIYNYPQTKLFITFISLIKTSAPYVIVIVKRKV